MPSSAPAPAPAPAAAAEKPRPNSVVGKLVAGMVVVIVLAVIFMRGDQLVELADTVQRGAPLLALLAMAAQLGKYVAQGFAFCACYRVVGEKVPFRMGLSLVFGIFFVNTIAPSLNLAGTSLVVDRSIKSGISGGKGASVALLVQLCIDSGFALIMLLTFTILGLTVGLDPGWFVLGFAAVLLVGGLAGVIVLASVKPELVKRLARPVVGLVNRVLARFKRNPVDEAVYDALGAFSASAGLIVKYPKKTARAFGCTFTSSLLEICCFVLTGLAFGVQDPAALICGYVVATLFAMISFIPQGVGVVEAAVVVAFGLFGIGSAAALTVVMVYRALVFWMPFLIGAVVVQLMSRRSRF